MATAGKGAANNAEASIGSAAARHAASLGVLPAGTDEADILAKLADEAEDAVARAEAKRDRMAAHLDDAEAAVGRARKDAERARRAANKAKS